MRKFDQMSKWALVGLFTFATGCVGDMAASGVVSGCTRGMGTVPTKF